jgi:hypothetical protein
LRGMRRILFHVKFEDELSISILRNRAACYNVSSLEERDLCFQTLPFAGGILIAHKIQAPYSGEVRSCKT